MPSITEILEDEGLISSNVTTVDVNNFTYFDNSTPKSTVISIARLNMGIGGFEADPIKSVNLTSDGKYWIVETYDSFYKDNVVVMTIDAKTLMSKVENGEWKSLDELKALYIADIQSNCGPGKPQKIIMNGKEVWKVQEYDYEGDSLDPQVEYVYVDVATGKSKNTWNEFNKFAFKNGWLTLNDVDTTIKRIDQLDPSLGLSGPSFRDALRDLYPET